MNNTKLIKMITAFVDDEIRDGNLRAEIEDKIKEDSKLAFNYDVQLIISSAIKKKIIKHPVPFSIHQKILTILQKEGKND